MFRLYAVAVRPVETLRCRPHGFRSGTYRSEPEPRLRDVFYRSRQRVFRIAERFGRIVENHDGTAVHIPRHVTQTLLRRYRRAVILTHDTPHHQTVTLRKHLRLPAADTPVRRSEDVGLHQLVGKVHIRNVLPGRRLSSP